MNIRAMLLASAVMAASGLWIGSAGAAPIRADTSLQGDGMFEQVQMQGNRAGASSGGAAMSRGPSISGGATMNRSAGPGPSGGAVMNRSGSSNWTGNRVISGGNWAANRDGRRFSDRRFRRGFRGPSFAFGFGPSYYDYGYPYYDDYAYGDDYVAASPGVADGDSYCQQRFRSYDPSTGTYLGFDGLRHPCP